MFFLLARLILFPQISASLLLFQNQIQKRNAGIFRDTVQRVVILITEKVQIYQLFLAFLILFLRDITIAISESYAESEKSDLHWNVSLIRAL